MLLAALIYEWQREQAFKIPMPGAKKIVERTQT
jgi:hypothetical protein